MSTAITVTLAPFQIGDRVIYWATARFWPKTGLASGFEVHSGHLVK